MKLPPARALRTCALALLAVAAGAAHAQPAAAQIARADSAAVLVAAAADLDRRGEGDAAAALYRYVVERFDGTPAAETARAWTEARNAGRPAGGGETELTVWATTYGTWLGVAVPLSLGADGSEPIGAGLLLGAPGGFFAGRAFARSRPLSLGQARAITWGGTWGALQGMALANAMDFGGGGDVEPVLGSMIVGSLAGIGLGAQAARREIRPGTATSATLGSLWGSWFGLASAILLDAGDRPTWGAMMVAGDLGLAAGAMAGSGMRLSRSRARLISVGGLVGGVAGLGAALLADVNEVEPAVGAALAGSVAGLALGGALTRRHDAERDASAAAPASGTLPKAGALLNRSGGAWSLSPPLPHPSLAAIDPALRRGGGLAWRVPLLSARF